MRDAALAAYFARIGYAGPATPTLDTLRALHALHPAAIPFENIDVLLDRGVDIDPDAIQAKLVDGRRGGYCFEQNGLLQRVLTALGFRVEGLIARSVWGLPDDAPLRPRTHKALRVFVDGEAWLADAGFGGCMMTAPLRMDVTDPQPTQHEPYRLSPWGEELLLEVEIAGGWRPLYHAVRQAQEDADFLAANWFTATHAASPVGQNLIAVRTQPHIRHVLLDNRLTIRRPGQRSETRFLDADELEHALADAFGLPVEPSWRPIVERAARASA